MHVIVIEKMHRALVETGFGNPPFVVTAQSRPLKTSSPVCSHPPRGWAPRSQTCPHCTSLFGRGPGRLGWNAVWGDACHNRTLTRTQGKEEKKNEAFDMHPSEGG